MIHDTPEPKRVGDALDAAPPALLIKGVCTHPNPPGCRGIRNPPVAPKEKFHSYQVKNKAWKIYKAEAMKLLRIKESLK